MNKELDEKLYEILKEHRDTPTYIKDAIAEIKAAILEHAVPAKKIDSEGLVHYPHMAGYNQAVTEITEKLK